MNFRICMICSQFYPVIGGAQKQTKSLAEELMKRGHQVFILTQKVKGLKNIEIKNGIKIYRKIFVPHFSFLFGVFYIISTFLFLLRKINKYDIIHCQILYLHVIPAIVIRRLFGKKVIVTIRATREYGDVARIKRIKSSRVIFEIIKWVDKFVTVSWEAKDELKSFGISERKIVRIQNFVDVREYHPVTDLIKNKLREKLLLPKNKKIVIFVGRLTPQKGIPYLISSWEKVVFQFAEAILLIVGDGESKKQLEEQVRVLRLNGKIIFLGKKSGEEVKECLQASDIFVLPSISEGIPNSLLEAMACGLPCITTRIGGNVDLIENGKNGILVEPEDSKELTEAILMLLNDEERCSVYGRVARQKIEKYYSKNIVVSRYEELYKKILR